jgi:hypothetical protein
MSRLFLRGMTGHDGFPIIDVYARARHTGLLDVYKGKPVITRHCRPIPERPLTRREARRRTRPATRPEPGEPGAQKQAPRDPPQDQSWVGGEVSGRRRRRLQTRAEDL